ncbi:MAG TPA: hypothetical protein VK547_15330, partial [Candidatus Udaeobacter sp.]|nr:hypothetical protein [Candidatus Udaeobacter sp.]
MRNRSRNQSIVALLVAAPLMLLPLTVGAQSMDLKTTPPPRERVAPAVPERDLQPQRPALPDRPKFLRATVEANQVGPRGRGGLERAEPAGGLARG